MPKFILASLSLFLFTACNSTFIYKDEPLTPETKLDSSRGYGKVNPDSLAEPFSTKSVYNFSSVQGWEEGQTPKAPEGFKVELFAKGLDQPRWLYELPNGDIVVSESKADQIRLFRDLDRDGLPDTSFIFRDDLDKPFGMLLMNDQFYLANTDAVLRFPYKGGETSLQGKGEKILDLPAGGYNNHWTRNLLASPDNSKIYVSVGSASNVGEHGMEVEKRRAGILEINPDGTGEKIYGYGLRNPVGMDWNPENGELWTAVNERDALGDNLVPDYITSVQEGGFYGWPYTYFGDHVDPRWADDMPNDLPKAIIPDYGVGSHTASLGLAFYDKSAFPKKYQNGVFIGQHGSWNRTTLNGYCVLFVPFENGQPSGKPEYFLTGFISDLKDEKVYGRPVGVFILKDGSMLVTDDGGDVIWRVTVKKT